MPSGAAFGIALRGLGSSTHGSREARKAVSPLWASAEPSIGAGARLAVGYFGQCRREHRAAVRVNLLGPIGPTGIGCPKAGITPTAFRESAPWQDDRRGDITRGRPPRRVGPLQQSPLQKGAVMQAITVRDRDAGVSGLTLTDMLYPPRRPKRCHRAGVCREEPPPAWLIDTRSPVVTG